MPDLVWWEIESRDPAAFQQFAGDIFGWRFEPAFQNTDLGADYWIIRQGERSIGGLQRADERAASPQIGTRLYFDVDDLEGTLEQVVRLGGTVERSRTDLGGDDRWFATFREPTGISVGLWTANSAPSEPAGPL